MRAIIVLFVLLVASPSPVLDQTISGRILAIRDAYHLTVRDDRGYIDAIELHQGTVINPTGIELEPGMDVKIIGYNAGAVFAANEIDTPYDYVPFPWPGYYGPGW